MVANSGSVGMPYDGDPRASYLLIEDGNVTIRRVVYDVDAEIQQLHRSGYPRAAWLSKIRRQAKYGHHCDGPGPSDTAVPRLWRSAAISIRALVQCVHSANTEINPGSPK